MTVALLGSVAPVGAQQPVELGEPVATAAEPLSSLDGLRQLDDGSLLVTDGLEGQLVRVAPDLSEFTAVGNRGPGPAEYRTPDALFAVSGDSTLMVDLGNGRLALLEPDGKISKTIPIAGGRGPRMTIRLPGAVDDDGRIYVRQRGRPGPGGIPDSGTVVRYDPDGDRATELASVKTPEVSMRESGPANARNVQMWPVPLSPEDAWTVTPDGRLVIARQGPSTYWLEFVGDEGMARGPDAAYDPLPVRVADRDAWIAGLSDALGMSIEEENGRRRMSFSRGGGPTLEAEDLDWPERKPAFPGQALRVAPDGRFWLERHVPAGESARFDVLDSSGRRIGIVRLPEGRRLVGFGDGAVYLSRTDELDFTWLEKYRPPRV